MEQLLKLDAIQVELGYTLVHLADQSKKGDLLSRVTGIRKNFAKDMGVVIPPIKVKDNLQLQGPEYRLILKGEEHARGEIHADRWLAMNASDSKEVLDGIQTTEPVYKLPATWISNVEKKKAELKGFTVVDATTVLVTHLSETIKQQAAEILTRQDVQHLLDNLKETHATVINELIPAQLSIGQVHRVLQNLLAEGLSIRNLSEILERVSDVAPHTKNPDELSEHARLALTKTICKPYISDDGLLHTLSLSPELEKIIGEGIRKTPSELALVLEPNIALAVIETFSQGIQHMTASGLPPVLVCGPQIRMPLYRFLKSTFANLTVISLMELPNQLSLKNVMTLSLSSEKPREHQSKLTPQTV